MKRNWDLIRRILLKLEEKAVPEDFLMSDQIQGFDRVTVAYHFKLLHQAGLIEGMDSSSIGQFDFYVTGLTWQGHEFLDKIRNDTLSNLVQEYNPMDVIKKYQQAVEIEPKITKAVTTIIASVDGEVAGLEYRLKSMDSLKRKIETEMTAGISEQQAIDNIKDVIRYTAIFSPENFVTQYREMQSALEKQGYKTIIVKNTWRDGAVYKGINTFITTLVKKDNVIFEMQYHTSESFALKNGELHQLYERFLDPNTEQEEKEKLYIEMQKLSAKLVMPKDIQKIKGVK